MKTNVTRDREGLQLYLSQYREKRGDVILYFDINGENPTWLDDIKWTGENKKKSSLIIFNSDCAKYINAVLVN